MLFGVVTSLLAVGVGVLIGYGFGLLQAAARRRNEQKESAGQFKSAWSLMPGSGARTAYLVLTLVLIQVICPLFFRESLQWWISGGVLLGYGAELLRHLLERRRAVRH